MLQKPLFALQTATVAGKTTVCTDYAVAGNYNGHAVFPIGIGDRSHRGRFANTLCLFLIVGSAAIRNLLQRRPNNRLKWRGWRMQRHIKLLALTCKILVQLGLRLLQMLVFPYDQLPLE